MTTIEHDAADQAAGQSADQGTARGAEDGRPDWAIAGDAWGHAARDWAYRFEPYARDAIDRVFNQIRIGDDRHLLDLACGSGYALGLAERRGARVAGLDASAALIEVAARRAPTADLRVGTMFDLPWADETFDAVTSFNGIWGGGEDAVAEAARVLRPGGSVAITFWGRAEALDLRDFFIVVGSTGPGVAEEMRGLAAIGAPGVAEAMVEGAGLGVVERDSTSAVLEFTDAEDAWRTLRSPGVVLPSLQHTGEAEVRRQVLEALAPFRADDGSYRLVNELTHVIARKPA